jgi:ubiquinone/menaquinone biosynthesis C-methylase UbiE
MAIDDREARERSGTWSSDAAAADWQRGMAARMRMFGVATERMLELADIRAGTRVLDIGAGSGDQTLAAARRTGSTGYVLATDISASMLQTTAMVARQAGLSNVETRVMGAEQLELPSDSFDVVISRFALMLIPDIPKALAEIHRVLRTGGRLAALVFSECAYLSIPHSIARRIGGLTSPPEPFGEFRLAESGVMRDAYQKAGFRDISIREVATRRLFPSIEAALQYAKETPLPLRELTDQLSPPQREQAWAEIESALRRFVGPNGYDSPCNLLLGLGTK